MDGLTVQRCAATSTRRERSLAQRVVDHPNLDLTIGYQAQRDGEVGKPVGEVVGSIKRVNKPHGCRCATLQLRAIFSQFLAKDAIVGECGAQPRMDHTLGSHVRLGHGVDRTLEANLTGVPKGCANQRPGLVGNIDGDRKGLRCRQRGVSWIKLNPRTATATTCERRALPWVRASTTPAMEAPE